MVSMSVQAMKFVSMIGPVGQFEPFVLGYVLESDIQLERAYQAMTVKGLTPFFEENPYEGLLKRMNNLIGELKAEVLTYQRAEISSKVLSDYDFTQVSPYLSAIEDRLRAGWEKIDKNKREILEREQIMRQIEPMLSLDVDISQMFHVSYMKFRFGKMPRGVYAKQKENFDKLDVIVIPVSETEEDVWLSYYMPEAFDFKIDSVFSAVGFERVRISDMVAGTPAATLQRLQEEIDKLKADLTEEERLLRTYLDEEKPQFEALYNRVLYRNKAHEIKSWCSHTKDSFFLVGWMPETAFIALQKEIDPMSGVMISCENPANVHHSKPPTILKNAKIFKPFESLVTMYGLPSHDEMDPTIFVTLTFVFMFGFMFGDVGQGVLIVLAGAFLYFRKKIVMGGVLLYAGISSTIFGFLYGSIFGNEHVMKALWLSPIESSSNINQLLFISIGYGSFIILVTIAFNMINAIRSRDWGRLLFDRNGVAGLIFYGGILTILLITIQTGKLAVTGLVLALVIGLPLVMMFLKEPLENLLEKKHPVMPHEKGMYFVESGFELFETILGFLSNTISFVRVSAMALNHAGLSLAIWTIYDMVKGTGGIVALIIGNMLIIGLEGMIVGIQCLRLEYYEIFGRFYRGEGQAFRPLRIKHE